MNSDYSIELVESANFVEDEIEFNIFVFESTLFRLDFMGYTSLDLILDKSDVDIFVDDSNLYLNLLLMVLMILKY